MPSVFRTHFKTVGFPALVAQFGESVTYYPRSGGSKVFDAMVIRSQFETYTPSGDVVAQYLIRFLDDCTGGVSATDIDTGGDEIEIIANEGDTAKTRVTVLSIVSQANGEIQLALG